MLPTPVLGTASNPQCQEDPRCPQPNARLPPLLRQKSPSQSSPQSARPPIKQHPASPSPKGRIQHRTSHPRGALRDPGHPAGHPSVGINPLPLPNVFFGTEPK